MAELSKLFQNMLQVPYNVLFHLVATRLNLRVLMQLWWTLAQNWLTGKPIYRLTVNNIIIREDVWNVPYHSKYWVYFFITFVNRTTHHFHLQWTCFNNYNNNTHIHTSIILLHYQFLKFSYNTSYIAMARILIQ